MDIKTLSIDLETRSGADISKAGLYRYAEDPDFDVLLSHKLLIFDSC